MNSEYLEVFLTSALVVAVNWQGLLEILHGASASTTVASQIRHVLLSHGIQVSPSGLFLSDVASPKGSKTDGMFDEPKERLIISVIIPCR